MTEPLFPVISAPPAALPSRRELRVAKQLAELEPFVPEPEPFVPEPEPQPNDAAPALEGREELTQPAKTEKPAALVWAARILWVLLLSAALFVLLSTILLPGVLAARVPALEVPLNWVAEHLVLAGLGFAALLLAGGLLSHRRRKTVTLSPEIITENDLVENNEDTISKTAEMPPEPKALAIILKERELHIRDHELAVREARQAHYETLAATAGGNAKT